MAQLLKLQSKTQTTSKSRHRQAAFEIVSDKSLHENWPVTITLDQQSLFQEHQQLRLRDILWRLENRQRFKQFLMLLLIGQNIAVFGLVGIALYLDRLQSLQLIFSILTTATLAETASMIFFIIKWLFSEIIYQDVIDEAKPEHETSTLDDVQ